MAKREDIYTAQLKALGVYDPAFDPLIRDLAKAERRRTRVEKAWAKTAPPGGKPSFLDPHWQIIQQLDREILIYREAMGLTPKSLRKLRGSPEPPAPQDLIAERLNTIVERVGAYQLPNVSEFNAQEGGAPHE